MRAERTQVSRRAEIPGTRSATACDAWSLHGGPCLHPHHAQLLDDPLHQSPQHGYCGLLCHEMEQRLQQLMTPPDGRSAHQRALSELGFHSLMAFHHGRSKLPVVQTLEDLAPLLLPKLREQLLACWAAQGALMTCHQ